MLELPIPDEGLVYCLYSSAFGPNLLEHIYCHDLVATTICYVLSMSVIIWLLCMSDLYGHYT